MAKIPFNVSANTARLIGRENISNLESALTELVKNAYDADATMCIIHYDINTNSLWLMDNGIGMTKEIVNQNWMTIGNSSKIKKFRTDRGRIQTGEKGIGRFALDRIASNCKMHSISKKSNFTWTIDWDNFASSKLITEIYAEIDDTEETIADSCLSINHIAIGRLTRLFFQKGTCFHLTNLRDDWNPSTINRVKLSLARLLPPSLSGGFQLLFFTNDVALIKDSKIKSAFIDSYDYRVHFKLNEENVCDISIYRNEFDFGIAFEQVMRDAEFTPEDREFFMGKPKIIHKTISELLPNTKKNVVLGAISGDIYFYKLVAQDRNEEKFYYKDFSRRKSDIKEISGIKIYRDNFIVRPYGFADNTEHDWLSLSTRHSKSPAGLAHPKGNWTVSNNQISGQIHISRFNKNLPDKSSREGIVETPEFILFKEFVISIIRCMEEDRQYVGRKLDQIYKEKNNGEASLERAKQIISEFTFENQNEKKDDGQRNDDESSSYQYHTHYQEFEKAIRYQEERIDELEEEMGMLRTLATTGIVVNTYIHEIKAITTKINMGIKEALELLLEDNDTKGAIYELQSLRQVRNSFNSWFKVTLDAVGRDKRTMRRHNVNHILKDSVNTWKSIQNQNIDYVLIERTQVIIRCFPYDFESIINNLFTNSNSAFKQFSVEKPKITIEIDSDDLFYHIRYKDNGPGLNEDFKKEPEKILKHGITDRRDANDIIVGTGMGLWIVNNIISDYHGHVDVSKNKDTQSGFVIDISFRGRE